MDTPALKKDRLKLIVRNLRQLLDALESEVYSDVDAYNQSKPFASPLDDYDEIYIGDDDDGYTD